MKHVAIRSATMDDYDAICGLLKETDEHHASILPKYFQTFSGSARPRELIASFVEPDDARVFLAEVADRPAGCLMVKLTSHPEFPMFNPYRFALVDSLVVGSEYRRRGIATKLFDQAKTWVAEQGIKHVQVNVWAANAAGLCFYKKQGFETLTEKMELDLDV